MIKFERIKAGKYFASCLCGLKYNIEIDKGACYWWAKITINNQNTNLPDKIFYDKSFNNLKAKVTYHFINKMNKLKGGN